MLSRRAQRPIRVVNALSLKNPPRLDGLSGLPGILRIVASDEEADEDRVGPDDVERDRDQRHAEQGMPTGSGRRGIPRNLDSRLSGHTQQIRARSLATRSEPGMGSPARAWRSVGWISAGTARRLAAHLSGVKTEARMLRGGAT